MTFAAEVRKSLYPMLSVLEVLRYDDSPSAPFHLVIVRSPILVSRDDSNFRVSSFLPSSPLIALSPFPIERVENFKTVPENRREEDGMDGQREGSSSNNLKYVKPGFGGIQFDVRPKVRPLSFNFWIEVSLNDW